MVARSARGHSAGGMVKTRVTVAHRSYIMRERREDKIQNKRREQIFRYWVEVRSLQDGSIRKLPMTEAMMVPLVSSKINPQPSSRWVLRLQDDTEILGADDFEEHRVQLQRRYPDEAYERTINWERDIEAEQRRERALNGLARRMAEAAVEDTLLARKRMFQGLNEYKFDWRVTRIMSLWVSGAFQFLIQQ